MTSIHPLTKFRKNNNLSKAALADLLGTSRANITRWENENRRPGKDLLPVIYEKTGIAPRDLRPDLVEMIGARK